MTPHQIQQISNVDELPDGIQAVIKLADKRHLANGAFAVNGQLWFDRENRVPNGTMIETTPIISLEGVIATTAQGRKYIVDFVDGGSHG